MNPEEIKYRGKRIGDGKWVFGLLWIDKTTTEQILSIVDKNGKTHQIISNTMDRYIGQNDIKNKEIYGSDIVEFDDIGEEGYEYSEGFDFKNQASVVYKNFRWELENFGSNNSAVLYEMNNDHKDFIRVFSIAKVVGNLHDDPNFLKNDKRNKERIVNE